MEILSLNNGDKQHCSCPPGSDTGFVDCVFVTLWSRWDTQTANRWSRDATAVPAWCRVNDRAGGAGSVAFYTEWQCDSLYTWTTRRCLPLSSTRRPGTWRINYRVTRSWENEALLCVCGSVFLLIFQNGRQRLQFKEKKFNLLQLEIVLHARLFGAQRENDQDLFSASILIYYIEHGVLRWRRKSLAPNMEHQVRDPCYRIKHVFKATKK